MRLGRLTGGCAAALALMAPATASAYDETTNWLQAYGQTVAHFSDAQRSIATVTISLQNVVDTLTLESGDIPKRGFEQFAAWPWSGDPQCSGYRRQGAFTGRKAEVSIPYAGQRLAATVWALPDVALDALGLAAPRRPPRLFLVSVAASLAGTIVLFLLATAVPEATQALILSVPAIDAPMLDEARETVAAGDPASLALFGAGTPLKVYTLAWATGPGTLPALLVGAVINRCTRIVPGLVVAAALGAVLPGWLRRHQRLVVGAYLAFWIVIYAAYLAS